MQQVIKEILGLVDAHKDAQAGREYAKLPHTRAALEARLRSELEQHMQELRAYEVTVSKLRAELEAIGAGGVEPLRKCAGLMQIQEPANLAVVQQGVQPLGYVNTYTGQFFKDVEQCRQNNEGNWRTVYTHPTQQGLAQDAALKELIECKHKMAELIARCELAEATAAETKEHAVFYRHLRDMDWYAEPRLDAADGTVWKLTMYSPQEIVDASDDDSLDAAIRAALAAQAKQGGEV